MTKPIRGILRSVFPDRRYGGSLELMKRPGTFPGCKGIPSEHQSAAAEPVHVPRRSAGGNITRSNLSPTPTAVTGIRLPEPIPIGAHQHQQAMIVQLDQRRFDHAVVISVTAEVDVNNAVKSGVCSLIVLETGRVKSTVPRNIRKIIPRKRDEGEAKFLLERLGDGEDTIVGCVSAGRGCRTTTSPRLWCHGLVT